MRTIQASDAKARLLQLLDLVERGESIVITRHGRPIARLEPETSRRQGEIDAAIAEIRTTGRRHGKISAQDLITARDQGRRS